MICYKKERMQRSGIGFKHNVGLSIILILAGCSSVSPDGWGINSEVSFIELSYMADISLGDSQFEEYGGKLYDHIAAQPPSFFSRQTATLGCLGAIRTDRPCEVRGITSEVAAEVKHKCGPPSLSTLRRMINASDEQAGMHAYLFRDLCHTWLMGLDAQVAYLRWIGVMAPSDSSSLKCLAGDAINNTNFDTRTAVNTVVENCARESLGLEEIES